MYLAASSKLSNPIINTIKNAQTKKESSSMPQDFRITSDGVGRQSQTETSLKPQVPFGKGMSHAQRLAYLNDPEAYIAQVDGRVVYD